MAEQLKPQDWDSLRQRFRDVRHQYEVARRRFIAQRAAGPNPIRVSVQETVMGRLQARLETMPTIEQAKGIIMAESGVSPDEAFDILRRASQRTNIKLRDLAVDIVTKAEHPRGPSRPASAG